MDTPRTLSALDITDDDHVLGDPHCGLILLEYGDYECSFCGHAHRVVKQLQRELGKNMCFVFRHFPLRGVHRHSENAAEAAEAVEEHGDFWTMHDLLFENQDTLSDADLMEYGFEAGMNPDELSRDLASHTYYPGVQRDVLSGMQIGVKGTPTFFINGQRHDGGHSFQSLLDAIELARQAHAH